MIKTFKKLRNKYLAFSRKKKQERNYRQFIGRHVMSDTQANETIYKMIMDNKPCFISRFGSSELATVLYYRKERLKDAANHPWNTHHEHILCDVSGFFPFTQEAMDRFAELYLSFIKNIDLLGVWNVGEDHFAGLFKKNIKLVNLAAIEPYYFDEPWSRALEGKKVLVVHPFANYEPSQYAKKEKLFANKNILPAFELKVVQAVQSVAGNTGGFIDWFAALEYMCEEISRQDFDVAIIGAGAYGMPLADFIKMKMGKVAIHMGGATQLLFGIKGMRWNDFPEIKKMYNDYWINPSAHERPAGLEKVEGGSYW